jgi:acyl-CoA synthetase (AMP-forming)/AMP-acid ligase II
MGAPLHPDLAVLLTTSGSTGSPKLVRLSHRAVAANAAQIVEALRMGPDDRAVTTLSPAYSFGLSVINSHLLCGGSLLLTGRTPLEREFWADLAEHGVTTLPGVPFTFDMVRRAGGAKLAPASLRKLIQAGGAMAPAMVRWTREAFAGRAELFVMYGQTEATARIAVLPPEELEAHMGAVGRPVPGGRAEIDGDGQIVFHGPNVMMGYAQCRADLERGDEMGGVLPTGDLGRIGDNGLLWITGRLKRIAKPFGLRLNLDDIEARLGGSGVLAVTGDDSAIQVVVESGGDDTLRAAIQSLAAELKLPASLIKLRRVDQLPRTANGKIDYRELGRV